MKDAFLAILTIIGFIVVVFGLMFWGLSSLYNHERAEATVKCQAQYGKEWTGTTGRYGRPDCIAPNGDSKYLQN